VDPTDPTRVDETAKLLAYLHPAFMVATITLVLVVLREGIRMRKLRLARKPVSRALRDRHTKLAKPAVAMVMVGLLGGVVSIVELRARAPLGTFHAFAALLSASLFGAAAWIGHRIEARKSRAVEAHGWLGLAATLAAALASLGGFVLLP